MSNVIDETVIEALCGQLLEHCTEDAYDIHTYEAPSQTCYLHETPSVAGLITTLLELKPDKHVFIMGGISTGHKIQVIDRPDGVFIAPY